MRKMMKRMAIETEDRLRYSRLVRSGLGRLKLVRDALTRRDGPQELARAINQLCAAARLAPTEQMERRVETRILEKVQRLDINKVDLTEFVPELNNPHINKAAVIKPWVSDREKGVIFVGFEWQWAKLLRHTNLEEFARRYTVVVAPSSSPYNIVNFLFPAIFPQPVFSLINHPEDVAILHRISANYRVVPLFTSHWVNPGNFVPRPDEERDTDILMVASFGKVKRHHIFFRALREIPENLKVVLIGQNQEGRTAETILAEARLYGVANRLTVRTSLPHEAVANELCRAKVSVLMSRREGSAVVVSESLFAGTPVALLEDAYNGSRSFINPATGCLVTDRNLARQLLDLLARRRECRPRQWAEENISCFRSTQILNDTLRQHALAAGQAWTRDIAPACWRPDPQLVRPEDAPWLPAERERIRASFGVEIG
jgi:glycosyltransferase involved in cell wall biosynthesis